MIDQIKNGHLIYLHAPGPLNRRLGPGRRAFTYSRYFPERRSGTERRCAPGREKVSLCLVKRASGRRLTIV